MTNENNKRNERGLSEDSRRNGGNGWVGSGRGSNLTNEDRSRGGKTSAQNQGRDGRGQFAGRDEQASRSSTSGNEMNDADATNLGVVGNENEDSGDMKNNERDSMRESRDNSADTDED